MTSEDEKVVPFMIGASYEGEWENNMKHGVGIETWKNLIYEGRKYILVIINLTHCVYHLLKSLIRWHILGEYQYNKRHGQGVLYKMIGTKNVHNARKSGKDIKRKIYDGEWANGLKDGTGSYYYKNGMHHFFIEYSNCS